MISRHSILNRADRASTVVAKLAMLARHRQRRAFALRVVPSIENLHVLQSNPIAHVIDVGANRGQFALASRLTLPEAGVVCFEPGAEARQTLSDLFAGDDKVEIFPYALGDADGSAELLITEADDNSSLLKPAPSHWGRSATTNVVGTQTVEVRKLDSVIAADSIPNNTLLKIDVQGFEMEVLAGATEVLANVRWVLIEASFAESYVGQQLAAPLVTILAAAGLELAGVGSVSRDRNGNSVQADLLFARDESGEPLRDTA